MHNVQGKLGILKLKKTEKGIGKFSQDPLQQSSKAQNELPLCESTTTDTSFSHMTPKQLKNKIKEEKC